MARRSVVVLDSFGCKTGYTTYAAAQSDCDAGRAARVSERCIRLLSSSDGGGEWRKKPSDGFLGYAVLQLERRDEDRESRLRRMPEAAGVIASMSVTVLKQAEPLA